MYRIQIEKVSSVSEPIDPISGVLVATFGTVKEVTGGITDYPIYAYHTAKASRGVEGSSAGYPDPSTPTKGLGRIVVASLSAPRDLTLALTKGFHNAPKIYGDEELRQPPVVVGLKSGMMAAGKGLATGLYDGLSGFVMQPVKGAKEIGLSGFAKGMGKGIGGLICKPCAGYALEGIHVELKKSIDRYMLKGE
ncbi:Glycosyltransferase family 28 domain-containing protein [Rutstroemia sp. NJR-2017a BBW]|nr:Glycosyltransferase family 28 domain-containing protein [Rutstroemia sp. NJR-2017a BBW]